MAKIIVELFNRGVAAGWLILAVILVRTILKKSPKSMICFLWGIVGIRLVCPFSLKSIFSLIPSRETLLISGTAPVINSGIPAVNKQLNTMLYRTGASSAAGSTALPDVWLSDIWLSAAGAVWLAGCLLLLSCAVISYLRMRAQVREAVWAEENIWVCDAVCSPFILGFIRPAIYLPSGMEEGQKSYVIAHERVHLSRRDYIWKPLGCLLLAVYWFHPLVWAAYLLFCRDVEMACDETVIKEFGAQEKKAYSHALLSCSLQRRAVLTFPAAFGEIGVKERVKMVLNYKKPGLFIKAAAAAVCITVAVCFLTDPLGAEAENQNQTGDGPETISIIGGADGPTSIFLAGKLCGSEIEEESEAASAAEEAKESRDAAKIGGADGPTSIFLAKPGDADEKAVEKLYNLRTPYVGDASAVGRLMMQLTDMGLLPAKSSTMSIQSEDEPYGLTISYEETLGEDDEVFIRLMDSADILLALVDNLSAVEFSFPFGKEGQTEMYSMYWDIESANDFLQKDVKRYADTLENFRELYYLEDTLEEQEAEISRQDSEKTE